MKRDAAMGGMLVFCGVMAGVSIIADNLAPVLFAITVELLILITVVEK